MDPVREEDHVGAVCFRATGELYLGHQRGRIGNEGGFKEDAIADYLFTGVPEENFFYATGKWASTAEYFEAVDNGPHTLQLKYAASAVNLVMACPRAQAAEVAILQDGKPLTRNQATRDTQFRPTSHGGAEEGYVVVDSARMYFLVENHDFGRHTLELRCSPGIAAFAFTFTSCVDPVASALQATSVPEP
jgi:hypothetical protein